MKLLLTPILAAAVLVAPATAATLRPTPAAIIHWKSTALKPTQLPAWWRGYLAGPTHFSGCKMLAAKGVPFYDCKVTNRIDGLVLALAGLARLSRCGYAYTFSSTHGKRQFTRAFRLCG